MASLLQRLFRRPDYNSDITDYLSELKERKPDLEAQQRAGRAIWWDKHLDRELLEEWQDARVPSTAYAYFEEFRGPR
jgi:hypothetical protein